jgi:hypothetical protein
MCSALLGLTFGPVHYALSGRWNTVLVAFGVDMDQPRISGVVGYNQATDARRRTIFAHR